MLSVGDDTVIATLDAIIDDAIAVTIGASTASSIDEQDIIRRLGVALSEVVSRAAKMIDVLDRLQTKLDERLKSVPEAIKLAALEHRIAILKWQPAPPPMPREAAAFIALERLQTARATCIYERAKARYKAIRKPGDRCDCAARTEAQFMSGKPEAPLKLVGCSGVPYAAMDYVWLCEACGTTWHQAEGYDDTGSHSTWSPASTEAVVR